MQYNREDVVLKMYFEPIDKGMNVASPLRRYAIKMIHKPTGVELFIPADAMKFRSDIKNIDSAHEMMEYAVLCVL